MNALIESFLQYMRLELNRSTLTVESYGRDLRQLEAFLRAQSDGNEVDVALVTASDIRSWLILLSDAGDGSRTLRRKVQAARAFFKWLVRRGAVTSNVAAEVELSKLPRRLPEMVRTSTLDNLLDAPLPSDASETELRDRLIVMMLYETGIRRAELIGLLDSNVDTETGIIKVRGKRDKDRYIPIGPELAEAIDRYRAARSGTAGTLFTRPGGEALYPSLVYRVVTGALGAAGVSGKRSPHVLRHTFATAMLDGGAGINSVRELLGHSSLAATQVYTHVTFSELKHNYELAHPRALKD